MKSYTGKTVEEALATASEDSCTPVEELIYVLTDKTKGIFAKKVVSVNLSTLNRKFEDGADVTIEALVNAGVIKNSFDAVKVLGNGKLDKKLNVKVSAFSESAKAAIEAAGGKVEVM